jgi:hypothetical protein
VSAEGVGTYFPANGMFYGNGSTDVFGDCVATGRVESEFAGPLTLVWQNFGNANGKGNGNPNNEVLDRWILDEGTFYTRSKHPGTVQLIADKNNPNFDPAVGPFTAEWVAEVEIVKGTGIFKGAKGSAIVTASNPPFLLTDPTWAFTWTWDATIRLTGRNK